MGEQLGRGLRTSSNKEFLDGGSHLEHCLVKTDCVIVQILFDDPPSILDLSRDGKSKARRERGVASWGVSSVSTRIPMIQQPSLRIHDAPDAKVIEQPRSVARRWRSAYSGSGKTTFFTLAGSKSWSDIWRREKGAIPAKAAREKVPLQTEVMGAMRDAARRTIGRPRARKLDAILGSRFSSDEASSHLVSSGHPPPQHRQSSRDKISTDIAALRDLC